MTTVFFPFQLTVSLNTGPEGQHCILPTIMELTILTAMGHRDLKTLENALQALKGLKDELN